ncbi:MAG: 2-C-methyl-D-erythritol 2,4-cyclodiphosphate synthase [Candidatus Eisenbacteria bacterium]
MTRVGFGYDIHRLVEGRPLWLGGVEIAHDRGLLGHSDGDAAAHAVADALLGAAGLGDIGVNFPSDDPRYHNASGVSLLAETAARIRARGYRPVQVDLTVVAEGPKLAPHRESMITALAGALGLAQGAIAIKARTNEGLDAIGRGEAIAAYAVVLIERRNPPGE